MKSGAWTWLALVLIALPAAYGQTTSSEVIGSVYDPSGAGVQNGSVTLTLSGGTTAILETITSEDGRFKFPAVRVDTYDLTVQAAGFRARTVHGITVDAAQTTTVPSIVLSLQAATESITVVAPAESIPLSGAAVTVTVRNDEVTQLPTLDHNPLQLIHYLPGVNHGNTPTVINGGRPSYTSVTLDGINIQNNFLRASSLDSQPNLLVLDQISQFTLVTGNADASLGGGASHLVFAIPSGGNQIHGKLDWSNRNHLFSANSWFNNKDGIRRPFLNRNQIGASMGGPIRKDRLFFYGNYEAYRSRARTTLNRTILTADARNGVFTYRDSAGNVRSVNVLQTGGAAIDPFIQRLLAAVPGPEKRNNFRLGDSSEQLLRNTAGYSFLSRSNRDRDNATLKIDQALSSRNYLSLSLAWNRERFDRPTADPGGFNNVPKLFSDEGARFLSGAWRSNPSARLTNEVRGGFNLFKTNLKTSEQFDPFFIVGTIFSNPVNATVPSNRATRTFNLQDNAALHLQRHHLDFGFQSQHVRTRDSFDLGIIPTYFIGLGIGNPSLPAAAFPGISAIDFAAANALFATLAGYVTTGSQAFNVTSRTSGYVSGAPRVRNYVFDTHAAYVQDSWNPFRRLNVKAGVRYEYYGVPDERDSLGLLPKINGTAIGTVLSNAQLDFAGARAGRPWYSSDRNNFAPNAALVFDISGSGRTVLRAGYGINFVNDDNLWTSFQSAESNIGLSAFTSRTGLSARVSTGLPQLGLPPFMVPRTAADNTLVTSQSVLFMPEPELATPYVQQWNIGIQHEVKGMILDARYIGNHVVKALRSVDFNQVQIRTNGFLDDFIRAQSNGNRARAATGIFDPGYNASIPGSQPLTVFPRLGSAGLLTNVTVRSLIDMGQAGELAAFYAANGLSGSVALYPNPTAPGGAYLVTNNTHSQYNALQLSARRRMTRGLQFYANYTFSKVLSDSASLNVAKIEPFLDLNDPGVERARAPFDITHAIRVNGVYALPFGPGHQLNVTPLRHVLGGWSVSWYAGLNSGSPFSVLSGRGTLNRAARSGSNTAVSTLSTDELRKLFRFRQTASGPFFADASIIGTDGRAVAPDSQPAFAGQVLFHPSAGNLGTIQRRAFSGPRQSVVNLGVMKRTLIKENQEIDLRMDVWNLPNHPIWLFGDQAISSTNFGRISASETPRVIQFGLIYRF